MSHLLRKRVAVSPDATAIIAPDHLDQPVSYAELLERTERMASLLRETGICTQCGERVGILVENRPELITLFFGILDAGCTPVLFHAEETAYELREHWSAIDASLLICSKKTEAVAEEGVEHVPVLSIDAPAGERVLPIENAGDCTAHASDIRTEGDQVLLFTSGSTDNPKPVLLTMGNLRSSAIASGFRLGHLPSDVWYDPLPIHHIGGLAPIIRSALYGSAVLLHSFSGEETAKLFRDHRVSCASFVPTMLSRILQTGAWEDPPDALRFLLLGGSAIPPDLLAEARERGLPVCPTYGLTETASQVATARPDERSEDASLVGFPLFETNVTICDDSGRPVEQGEEGTIHVDGPMVMEGYFQRPLLNDRVLTSHGFCTDDRGYLDGAGRLHVVGGRSNRIITGGENVNPEEVRRNLREHPMVEDAAVFGIEDPDWGEKVVALVKPASAEETEDDLRSSLSKFLKERLASFKHPREIAIVEKIPRTPKGTLHQEDAEEMIRRHGT